MIQIGYLNGKIDKFNGADRTDVGGENLFVLRPKSNVPMAVVPLRDVASVTKYWD